MPVQKSESDTPDKHQGGNLKRFDMPEWEKIRRSIMAHPGSKLAWRGIKWLGTRSESPTSFGVLAFLGIAGLVALNLQIPLNELDVEAAQDFTPATEELPAKEAAPYIPPEETFSLRRGETLITLLRRATIDNSDAHQIVAYLKDITNLRRLQAGQEIRLVRRSDNGRKIATLKLRDSFAEEAVVRYAENRYKASREAIPTNRLTHYVEGEITDSLYLSAERAGLPKKVIVDLIRMMTFDIDFEREIRTGDKFQVYFERSYSPEFNDIENGKILRARITLRKRVLDAFFYTDKNGDTGYYDGSGQSTKRALMKTPLDVVYVTDSYGPRKKHPVLGYRTMHTGTDFRARPGTPIMASGDGVIEMAARNGSYGNYIRIRHNGTYKTAYAHLSRYAKGIKKGRRVKQGQVIGYSGATGRVNGPHLHYEVHVNGKPVNPLTLKLPSGKKLSEQDLADFQQIRGNIEKEIDSIFVMKEVLLTAESAPASTATDSR